AAPRSPWHFAHFESVRWPAPIFHYPALPWPLSRPRTAALILRFLSDSADFQRPHHRPWRHPPAALPMFPSLWKLPPSPRQLCLYPLPLLADFCSSLSIHPHGLYFPEKQPDPEWFSVLPSDFAFPSLKSLRRP